MNWGLYVKRLREERGMTQGELSRQSGVSRGHLSRIEIGSYKSCNYATLEKLAKGLNISLSELSRIMKGRKSVIRQETSEEILERLKLAQPVSIPVFRDFPFHAGQPVDPVFYVYRSRHEVAGKNIEGYLVHGQCLEPIIQDDDVIIVDRERAIDDGDVIACLIPEGMLIARLRKIAEELYLENNEGRIKLEEAQVAAPVIEVIRRLK